MAQFRFARLAGMIIALAGCADPGVDASDGTPPLQASCGAVRLTGGATPVLPSTPIGPEGEEAIASVDEVAPGEAAFFDQYVWFEAESTEGRLVLFGTPIGEALADSPPYADAAFTREADGWRAEGWGQCRIEVTSPGYGNAHWVLDPDHEPDETATELAVLINEKACASGEPPVGRAIVPVAVEETNRVTITVLVEPVSGGANCPSNPWHPITVELSEPLGSRALFDASTAPPLERFWPPSQSSLDSLGSQP